MPRWWGQRKVTRFLPPQPSPAQPKPGWVRPGRTCLKPATLAPLLPPVSSGKWGRSGKGSKQGSRGKGLVLEKVQGNKSGPLRAAAGAVVDIEGRGQGLVRSEAEDPGQGGGEASWHT